MYLINIRGAGNSVNEESESEYSMDETVLDLEAIREALRIEKWAFDVEIGELIPKATFTAFEQSNHYPFWEEEIAFDEFVKLTLES